jgi:hypothetical protein
MYGLIMGNYKDYATSLVATAPSPATTGTSLVVTAGQGTRFPSTPFYVTAHPVNEVPTLDNAEKLKVTAVSTDTFTIVREEGDTTAKSIAVGWRISNAVFTEDVDVAAFHAYRNATKNIGASVTDVVHDTELFDIGSNFNTTTGVFTAPVAGVYHFTAGASTSVGVTQSRALIYLVCSTAGTFSLGDHEETDIRHINGSFTVKLALNETAKIQLLLGTTADVASTGTYFAGFLVTPAS